MSVGPGRGIIEDFSGHKSRIANSKFILRMTITPDSMSPPRRYLFNADKMDEVLSQVLGLTPSCHALQKQR